MHLSIKIKGVNVSHSIKGQVRTLGSLNGPLNVVRLPNLSNLSSLDSAKG